MFFESIQEIVAKTADGIRPIERLTVAQAAEKYRKLNNRGSYIGDWRNDMSPYLVEPMNVLTSLDYTGGVFVSSAQSGKALALDTPILTLDGWETMGSLRVGQMVFGRDGKPTRIVAVSEVMRDHECFAVDLGFEDGIVADADHLWTVFDTQRQVERTLTTKEMVWNGFRNRSGGYRWALPKSEELAHPVLRDYRPLRALRIYGAARTSSVPVRCIAVDAPDRLYLAGRHLTPTHNTEIFMNWHLYTVMCDSADLMLVQTSQTSASDFSKRRIDRMHVDSPELGARLLSNADNAFDKRYQGGAMVTLSWPSINELSGKPIPRVFLTDYDRMPQDVDKNGAPFDLAQARTTTFRFHGMTFAESSPSFPVLDPRWIPKTKHEAPPCDGILKLYNRGDRRRWYWPCVVCKTPFEPDFSLMRWPETKNIMEAAELCWMECPHCGAGYRHDGGNKLPSKSDMNRKAFWLRDGEVMSNDGEITGEPFASEMASFWLKGVAATFKTWKTIVIKYLTAEQEYERTGSEDALKATINVDQGCPYLPKSEASDRIPEKMKERAKDIGMKVVPRGGRFLVATIDVQKNSFVVQVHAVGVNAEIWVIDRFDLKYSQRADEDRPGQVHWMRPFVYAEDWRCLMDEVILRTYPLGDGSGRHMAVKLTLCDSGGEDEGTSNAYAFWRFLKNGPEDELKDTFPNWTPGLHGRFQLVKGMKHDGAPRVQIRYPDSQRKGNHAEARGEIPILFLNSNAIKNYLDAILGREKDAIGSIHFANWLGANFYKELCVETKNAKGEWVNPKKFRNESWDLLCYLLAGLLENRHIGIERLDWAAPPSWACEWDENDLVFTPKEKEKPFAMVKKDNYDLNKLAQTLG